jgi:type I restriction enzyme, S subunit
VKNGWKPFKLKDICEQITDGKHGDCVNESNSGFYFLSAKDIGNGSINYENARQITEADFTETHRRTRFEPLDILFTNSGTIGRMAIAKDEDRTLRTTFQKSVAILKPNKGFVEPHFLYYLLLCDNRRLSDFAAGTAQKNLLLKDLRDFPVSIPSLPIQRRIAAILPRYDDLIENNTRRIQILEEMARRIYEEWFVRFRFPGHENVKMVESELGLIPEGWSINTLDSVATVNGASVKRGEEPNEILYVDIASVSTGKIDSLQGFLFNEAPGRARRIVKHGDIIWSNVRPNRKSYALIANPPQNMIVSTGFTVLSASSTPFIFLYQAVTTDDFANYLTNRAKGAAYPAVGSEDFATAKLIIPTAKLLCSFNEIVEPMQLGKNLLLRKNDNLRRTRDLLLPKLISGELDVSNFPEPEAL